MSVQTAMCAQDDDDFWLKNGLFEISDIEGRDPEKGQYIFEFIMSGEYQKLENYGFHKSGNLYSYLSTEAIEELESQKVDLFAEGGKKLIEILRDPGLKFIGKK